MLTRRKTLLVAAMLIVGSTLSFFTPAFAAITIKHSSGETTLPDQPQKVVVFDLATLDNLARMGLADKVIGVPQSHFPKYMTQYSENKYIKVGSLFEPNYETIAKLQPDLIIVAGRSQPKYQELLKIAPTIDLTVSNDNYLGDVDRNVSILGKLFDKEEQAKAEISRLDERLSAVHMLAANKGTGLIILTTGGKISAYGPGSRFGLLHSGFGIKPASTNLKVSKHGEMISSEYILKTNPDWLFVIDRDAAIGRAGEAAAAILDNALVNKTTASTKKQIVYLDPQNWYLVGGGLSGLLETADQLTKAFTPQ